MIHPVQITAVRTARIFLLLIAISNLPAAAQTVQPADISLMTGNRWQGSLTYRNYSDGKLVTIAAGLTAMLMKDSSAAWILQYDYPDEPHANWQDTVLLSSNGKLFDNQRVIKSSRRRGKTLQFVTTRETDGLQFRYTYRITPRSLYMRKEEKGPGDEAFFERNSYRFTR